MKKFSFALLIVITLTFASVFSVTSATGKAGGFNLYNLIDELIALQPFSVQGVSKIIKMKSERVDSANPYFDFYEFTGNNAQIKKAELRLPNSLSDKKDGMLIIEFSDSLGITLDDLYAKYGKEVFTFSPPAPTAPAVVPEYHSITISGQKISFGIARDKTQRLKSMVVDRIL